MFGLVGAREGFSSLRGLRVSIASVNKDTRVQQGMVTVTGVETTPDLRYAKVYLSILGEVNEKELRRGLRSAGPWLRRELGGNLTLRYTPELVFEIDHSIEYGAHINEVINSLEIDHDGDGENEDQ